MSVTSEMTDSTNASSPSRRTRTPPSRSFPSFSSLCPDFPSAEQLQLLTRAGLLPRFQRSSETLEQTFHTFVYRIVASHQHLRPLPSASAALSAALSTLHPPFLTAYTTVIHLFTARAQTLLSPPKVRAVRSHKPKPSPSSPSSTSGQARPSYPRAAAAPLRRWFIQHLDAPYPTERQKGKLSAASGLTAAQVCNWFVNARGRLWKKLILQQKADKEKERRLVEAEREEEEEEDDRQPHAREEAAKEETQPRKRQRTEPPQPQQPLQRPVGPHAKLEPLPAMPLRTEPVVSAEPTTPSTAMRSMPPLQMPPPAEAVIGPSCSSWSWTPVAAAGAPSSFSFTNTAFPVMSTPTSSSPTLFSHSLSRMLTAFPSPAQPPRPFNVSQLFRMSLTLSAFQPVPLVVVGRIGEVEGMEGEGGEGAQGAASSHRWRATWTQTQWEAVREQPPLSCTGLLSHCSTSDDEQPGSTPLGQQGAGRVQH